MAQCIKSVVKHWERKVVPSNLRVPVLFKCSIRGASECGGLLPAVSVTQSIGVRSDGPSVLSVRVNALSAPARHKEVDSHSGACCLDSRIWRNGCEFLTVPLVDRDVQAIGESLKSRVTKPLNISLGNTL